MLSRKTYGKKLKNTLQGIISISSKGTGYVATGEGVGKDPEINFRHLRTALHGDMVEIALHPRNPNRRQSAEVIKIISRAKRGFSGALEIENGIYFLKPDDPKMYTDILIPKAHLYGAKIGQKVFAEIVSWRDPMKAPEGKITRVLGKPGENNAEMEAIAMERGFVASLPEKVEREGEKIKSRGIKKEDYAGRMDFRKILTFTIDPADAKDFDDAISFKEIQNGEYEIGIHIADVSHYVKPDSALDEEARERGTSVYLVDRTIPMLPIALSDDLCSLLPRKDRLTLSAVFVIDKNGAIQSEWFGRTVIYSKKRFTYEEAEKSIKDSSAPFHKELYILNNLAKKLAKDRFAKGAISLDQEEVKFVLDKDGAPIKVIKKERGDSNKLIEEFMLLANRKVAEKISGSSKERKFPVSKSGEVFIYRVHGLPGKEKMADLQFFLRSLGHKISLKNGIVSPREINALLKKLKGKGEEDAVNRAVVRSMAKAVYSTRNIGHWGLAFRHYTHFTSPIRRYPDIMVHRILSEHLKGRKIGADKISLYEKMSIRASDQEKRAADAERASIKYKQVEYMAPRAGQKFEGIISGITEWGLYVEEMETKCEGLVRIRDINDDFYIFNEKKLELVGQKTKKRYRLGDRVKIKVKSADLEYKTIDYVLV
ncbi:ribonuclease R [Candidatus Nomurabacteria bacterium RIFCSPHIGHO2_02_FULL_41_18]|uniref:Ribonuclease R n=1 Tax=Candidatus Nomurabacteria bacterium RIFCSPHIGHO2_02_FULL_41_18 TaxID=1801754 RepID=A0A1F6W7E8_9BACT|nr:MAG: ribonuclease R [Candidatus Nomurabacteria bacterium RIFCSPHIGHO2_01_FULL_41_71]OGI77838.1 MAG: ribonuclease R [Candidatus Nomurabacteria bacterium RIFCSPHIGHO2_02_FULL_41_18]OGI89988.1 MAG: ribonuclease R [Candidatus Nomurabacteria bacterium RIFCSPLOWO2_01_FULL_41_52b]OGJ00135.1 MAG: ribonuclease R [Candidatus Nomurabacteria bacterium RIFCSPLOWO2_02_FULL_41_9]